MHYYLFDHKTHALETILFLPILPCSIIIYLVHSVNQADLSQNKKDHDILFKDKCPNSLTGRAKKKNEEKLNY
jgi:hypothetical protein